MGKVLSRRFVWTVLPAIALSVSVAGARTSSVAPPAPPTAIAHHGAVFVFDAAVGGDDPLNMADTPAGNQGDGFGHPAASSPSDLGLAAAGLANGPLATPVQPAPARSAAVAPASKSRLPEPATWVMLIGGMYGIGALLRRRHRASEAAFTAKIRAIVEAADEE